MTRDAPPPRALVAVGTLALEVALGAGGGAVGVLLLAPVLVRAPDLSLAVRVIAGLALWCALLAGVVRVARAARARARPALTVVVLALPALWLAAPVALATLFAVPAQAGGSDPFRVWGAALEVFTQTFTPNALAFSLAWGALVPFVLVGVVVASRPRTPPLALGVLGAAAGYLGLVVALGLLRGPGLDFLLGGARQAFVCGVPCAVVAMALASQRTLADVEQADRRAWRRVALAALAWLALIGANGRGHVRHAFDALARTPGAGANADRFERAFGRATWVERLDDPRVNVRWIAINALTRLGRDAATATPALLRLAASDEDGVVRWSAIDAVSAVSAGGVRYEATLPTMLELALRDPDWAVRDHAVKLLIELADPAAPAAFFEALSGTSSTPAERRAALYGLQTWWRAHPRDERSPSPRDYADALLRAHADPTFVDPDEAPRALYYEVARLDFDVVEHLAGALHDDDPRVRALAARTLRGPLSYVSWRLTPEQRRLVESTE